MLSLLGSALQFGFPSIIREDERGFLGFDR